MSPEKLNGDYQRILAENDHYLGMIHKHRDKLASVGLKMKDMKAMMLDDKKTLGGRIQTQRRSQYQRKHIRIMEDRVSQATTKFDKLLSMNQKLHNDIDHLRLQRNTFSKMHQRLKRELTLQYNVMEDLVEKSALAFDQRSEALARMLAVRERRKKDALLCYTEMTDLKRVIDHEIKLRSFMVKKFQESLPIGEDDEAKKKKVEQAQRERLGGDSLETYQAVHQHIVNVAGESDLGQIGKAFIENEEKSFAYFNYINELNKKSTMLNERINKLRTDILYFELDNKHYGEQWQKQLKELEGDLERRRGQANALQSQHIAVIKFLDKQKNAIANLFARMNCDPSPITVKLGCSAQVTNDNVTRFIGILEEQMHELLMVLALSTFKYTEEMELPPQNPLLASCRLLPAVALSTIEAPSSFTLDDTTSDILLGLVSQVPLNFQSLRERVLPCVMQTEQGKAPGAPSAHQRCKKKVALNPKSA